MTTQTSESPTPEEAKAKLRPLTVSQTRNMLAIIDEDYGNLVQQIKRAEKDRQDEVEEEIRATISWEERDALVEEGKETLRQIRDLRADFMTKCQELGLSVQNYPDIQSTKFTLNDEDLEKRIAKAKKQVTKEVEVAVSAVQQQRSAARREVLASSITADAEAILASLPTASDMLAEAAALRASERQDRRELTGKVVVS